MNRWRLAVILVLCGAIASGVGGCGDLATTTTTEQVTGTTGVTVTSSSEVSGTTTAPEVTTTASPETTASPATSGTTTPPGPSIWTNLDPGGPTPPGRDLAAMACNPKTGRVVMFGGSNWVSDLNDLWAYSPPTDTWTQLSPTGGPPSSRPPLRLL